MGQKRIWLCLVLIGCLILGYCSRFSGFPTGSFIAEEETKESSEIGLAEESVKETEAAKQAKTEAVPETETVPETEALSVEAPVEETFAEVPPETVYSSEVPFMETSAPEPPVPVRDPTPVVLVPAASGTVVYADAFASMDASHTGDGYVMVTYTGEAGKVKLQIETPGGVTYTYTKRDGYEVFPLTGGDGSYKICVWEQRPSKGDYINVFSETIDVVIADEFSPYLYPNQYVDFSPDSRTVALGSELVTGAVDDLDAVARVYTYVTEHISYDTDKARTVQSGYVPAVDEILNSGKGICFDYAAVMAAMLRTQRIPTRLEVGYAGGVYHAWISTHIDGIGWVNGIIQFDGSKWELMDPTLAANSSSETLKSFISDSNNYQVKYLY